MTAQEKWDALSESAHHILLERYRDVNVDHKWWDYTYEWFDRRMRTRGIFVGNKHFSGFWSQGDGACFEGHVTDWTRLLVTINADDEYIDIPNLREVIAFAKEHDIQFTWKHGCSNYCHENTISFYGDEQLHVDNPYDQEAEPLRHAAWGVIYGPSGLLAPFDDVLVEYLKDQMRGLYRALEDEYDHLTSDETVQNFILEYQEEDIDEKLAEESEEMELV